MMQKTAFLLLAAILVFSCKKKDNDQPVISNVNVSINNNDSLFAGGSLNVTMRVKDNVNLGGISVSLNEQVATYGYKTYAYDDNQQTMSLAGIQFDGTFTLNVKDSALAAPYNVLIEAFDKAGNQAESVTSEVYVFNKSMPNILLDSSSLQITDTTKFIPKGSLSVQKKIATVDVEVKRNGQIIFTKNWTYGDNHTYWSLDSIGVIEIPASFQSATFLVKCKDKIGNLSYKNVDIEP